MPDCPACGSAITDDSRLCPTCGFDRLRGLTDDDLALLRSDYADVLDAAVRQFAALRDDPSDPPAWLRELCKRVAAGSPPDAAASRIPLEWPEPGMTWAAASGLADDAGLTNWTAEERRVLTGVLMVLPNFRPDKATNSALISRIAAKLTPDEELIGVAAARVSPPRMRGAGLLVATDHTIAIADVHPSSDDYVYHLPAAEIQAASVTPQQFGTKVAIVCGDAGTVELLVPNQAKADDILALIYRVAPHIVSVRPRDVVAHWWEDPSIAWPRKLSLGNRWEYLGGLAANTASKDGLTLELTRAGLAASRPGALIPFKIEIPWERVARVQVEGAQQVQSRTTVTRLLAVGVFAFGWKKKLNSGFLVVELDDGSEVIFASARHTEPQLRAALSGVLAAARAGDRKGSTPADPQPLPDGVVSASERLRSLTALHQDGIITDDEFQAKRAALIEEL